MLRGDGDWVAASWQPKSHPSRGPRGPRRGAERHSAPAAVEEKAVQSHQLAPPQEKNGLAGPDKHGDVISRTAFAAIKRGDIGDNFSMHEELGRGAFGSVCRATDNRNERVMAVKTIPKGSVKDPNKLKQEFNVIRQMDHPHICKALECYEDTKYIYFVMELLMGGTLMEQLTSREKFGEGPASHIMRQVMSALAYLHEANFIFRDLKTENVVFSNPEGKEPADRRDVKLIDFGLCCQIVKGAKICHAAGTPYSVAPELVTTPIQYDQKCDAWSAGVVLFMTLCGKYPFTAKSKDELMTKIRKEPCKFNAPAWKRVSGQAQALVSELLRKQADKRVSVGEALQHKWFSVDSTPLDYDAMSDVVDGFRHFQQLNMFQKAAVTAVAWKALDSETAQLRDTFCALDRDGNGHITVSEVSKAIKGAGVPIPDNLKAILCEADTDGGGAIEYTEFLAACLDKRSCLREDVVMEAFRVFDQDGSGTISKKELLKVLAGTSDRLRKNGGKAIDDVLCEYDSTGDAAIDVHEFMNMLEDVKNSWMTSEVGQRAQNDAPHPQCLSPRTLRGRRSPRRISDLKAQKDLDTLAAKESTAFGSLYTSALALQSRCCCCSVIQARQEAAAIYASPAHSPKEMAPRVSPRGNNGRQSPPKTSPRENPSPRTSPRGQRVVAKRSRRPSRIQPGTRGK